MSEKDTPKIIEEKSNLSKKKKNNKDVIIEELQRQNKELTDLVKSILASQEALKQQSVNSYKPEKEDKKVILVGCRSVYPATLGTADERISYTFNHNEVREVDEKDLQECFKNDRRGNRNLFTKGVLYFLDTSWYEYFRLGTFQNFSPEYLQEWLLNHTPEETVEEFAKVTKNKNDIVLSHTLVHAIAYSLIENPKIFGNWKYDNRLAVEKYFDVEFEQVISRIKMYENKTPLI